MSAVSIGLGRDEHAATHGTKSLEELNTQAVHLPDFGTDKVTLENVEILKVTFEMAAHACTDVLPPALHPTFPPIVSWVFFECRESPWGRFNFAQTAVSCRSGTHPRAFLISAVTDNPTAAEELERRWAFKFNVGEVRLRFHYDDAQAKVSVGGSEILRLRAEDPQLLRPVDVHWIANMHYAKTPRGMRLVQWDPDYQVDRAERLTPVLESFDGGAWGEPLVRPSHPIAAAKVHANVIFPKIRYICEPDKAAFNGTEVLEENL